MLSKSRALFSLAAFVLAVPMLVVASPGAAQADTNFHPLTLTHGWATSGYGTSTPQARVASGIVSFKGAIATQGTNPYPFLLPANLRPAHNVFVKVSMCDATNGRLFIKPNGVVRVEAESDFSEAQCLTSLDGVSYALSAPTSLALENGWTGAPFGTAAPAATVISGIVHLQGAIATTGTTATAFTLPANMRPSAVAFVPVDMCNAHNGRLEIDPDGQATVQAASFSSAQCFTSLDGVQFARSASATLTPENGWTDAAFGTAPAARKIVAGIVSLRGAIANGTSSLALELPAAVRPAHFVYVSVDMCNASNGGLLIQPNGAVYVTAETSASDATCLTSLDGVSYAL